jgi:glycine cleavage system aminomethyltransferase T/glycine/D-amino acid oxidase-like deaminating enzyme
MTMTSTPPTHASVVVVGGGVMGCSTLYHLAKLGITDAVLLERNKLTSGTTWHSAAQVRQLRSSRNLTEIIRMSARLYAALEAETGQSTGWRQTGSLSIACNPDRLTHIKRQASLARLFGVEAQIVGAAEAARLWPLMNSKDVIGAVYSPMDGRVNPSDLCAALIKGAKKRGGTVVEDCPVTGFEIRDGRVRGVDTPHGRVKCEKVVNCAGLWGREVGRLADVSVPLYACEHFYLLTQTVEGLTRQEPTLSDHDGHLYIREEVGGLLVGCFEPNPKPLPLENLPKDFAFGLLNEDWDHFEPMMANAMHRIPALEHAKAKMLLNGPESFTPDGAFLLGETPEVRGFFLGCGMNSVGVGSGGGAGHVLAQWIVDDEPPMDLWSVDIRRFAPLHSAESLLKARIPEELALHYAISYPGREPKTARGLRLSPLHERLANKGARFGVRMGFERANWFARHDEPRDPPLTFGRAAWFRAVAEECEAARERVAIFDQSTFGKLLISGPDAETLLQRLCCNDVAVDAGRIVYTGMLNAKGGYESDLTVFRLAGDRYQLITGTAQPVRDAHWIAKHIAGARASVAENTDALSVISVMGPHSRRLLGRLTDEDLSLNAFPLFTFRELRIADAMVRAARLSYVGELGWELYVEPDRALAVYDALTSVGGDLGLRDAGMFALTSLRIEKSYRAWGHDITPDDTPFEAGLQFAVKLEKRGDFIGGAALRRAASEQPKRRLVQFVLDDPNALPIGGEPIRQHDALVGQVTSAAFGHTLGRAVALGYIQLAGRTLDEVLAEQGFALEIAASSFSANASRKAAYDPNGARMRS